jgi:hypothetical protein
MPALMNALRRSETDKIQQTCEGLSRGIPALASSESECSCILSIDTASFLDQPLASEVPSGEVASYFDLKKSRRVDR